MYPRSSGQVQGPIWKSNVTVKLKLTLVFDLQIWPWTRPISRVHEGSSYILLTSINQLVSLMEPHWIELTCLLNFQWKIVENFTVKSIQVVNFIILNFLKLAESDLHLRSILQAKANFKMFDLSFLILPWDHAVSTKLCSVIFAETTKYILTAHVYWLISDLIP